MHDVLRVLVNGRAQNSVPADIRGLQYGDGVFRTLLVRNSTPVFLNRQLDHLARDCTRLGLNILNQQQLAERCMAICNGIENGVLKIILAREGKSRGYRPRQAETTDILILYPPIDERFSINRREGVNVRICNMRLSINPALAGIKHLNRLEQVMAQAEWNDDSIAEGLMLDTSGHVIEATASNLFVVRDGALETPDLTGSGVAGLMREMIIEAASAYTSEIQIRELLIEDCMSADEVFLSNSVIGIWPVRSLPGKDWTTGPLTRKLQEHFSALWS